MLVYSGVLVASILGFADKAKRYEGGKTRKRGVKQCAARRSWLSELCLSSPPRGPESEKGGFCF